MKLLFWTLFSVVAQLTCGRRSRTTTNIRTSSHQDRLSGPHLIKSNYDHYLRAWANSTDWFVGTSKLPPAECERWYIERQDLGKVALKAYCSGQYLRSSDARLVDLAEEAQDHEMWTPTQNDDKSWCLEGFHGFYLRAQPHGRVSLQEECLGDEHFRFESWTDSEVAPSSPFEVTTTMSSSSEIEDRHCIKTPHSSYIRAWANETDWFIGTAPQCNECEQWYVEEHDEKVALRAHCSDKYLHAHLDRQLTLADKLGDHSLWTRVHHKDGSLCLQSAHETWLKADANGRLMLHSECTEDDRLRLVSWREVDVTTPATTATAKLSEEMEGQYCLKTTAHDEYLRGWANETEWFVGTAQKCEKCQRWYIEEHDGKVALKTYCSNKYLRPYVEHMLILSSEAEEHELWTPTKNQDGSWCLQSYYGTWLRAHGRLSLHEECGENEHFMLESWKEIKGIITIATPEDVSDEFIF